MSSFKSIYWRVRIYNTPSSKAPKFCRFKYQSCTKQNMTKSSELYTAISYFEKGCWKKCTRQSRKVLRVGLSSLFFTEIWRNDRRGHGRMFASAKGEQQKNFWQLQCQEPSVYWSYQILLFRDYREHIFADSLSRNSCICCVKWMLILTLEKDWSS